MKLTPMDLRSQLWLDLSAHMEGRLADLRRQNDSPNLGQDETSRLRGRIAQLKEILALAKQEPVQADATDEAAPESVNPQWVEFTQE